MKKYQRHHIIMFTNKWNKKSMLSCKPSKKSISRKKECRLVGRFSKRRTKILLMVKKIYIYTHIAYMYKYVYVCSDAMK